MWSISKLKVETLGLNFKATELGFGFIRTLKVVWVNDGTTIKFKEQMYDLGIGKATTKPRNPPIS